MSIIGAYIVPHPPVIIPEVGKGQERKVQATIDAYRTVAEQIRTLSPETVVIISPHSVMYADYIHISGGDGATGDFRQFSAPQVKIRASYDAQFADELSALAMRWGIDAGPLGERQKSLDHGTMVPLYFMHKAFAQDDSDGGFKQAEGFARIVRTSISGLSLLTHYQFGKCIKQTAQKLGRKTVIIASGDLSHRLKDEGPYDFAKEGPIFDEQVTDAMKTADFMKFLSFDEDFLQAAGECGLRSFVVMAGAFDRESVKAQFLSYEGTFGVGYAVCGFSCDGVDESRAIGEQFEDKVEEELKERKLREDAYVRLARMSLETFIKTGKQLVFDEDVLERALEKAPEADAARVKEAILKSRAGVFVSLKKDGKLRGCIGTISATQGCVGEEIVNNAVSAGVGDTRFDPVSEIELSRLVYSVDVLSDAEPIDSKEQLDTDRYGVIVSYKKNRGLLLPNLAGVTEVDQQIKIALRKAGIPESADYRMERFEVVRHH